MRGNAGVFAETTNRRAFLDRVDISINGRKRTVPGAAIRQIKNSPIGGIGRNYAWKMEGVLRASENPCVVVHGKMRLQSILPSLVMTIRSQGSPITADGIIEGINTVAEKGWSAKVSHIELTFDFRGVSTDFLWHSIVGSAHTITPWPGEGELTSFYVGGRTSPIQILIYQKTKEIVRLEFRFRRPFLRSCSINGVTGLTKLRKLDLQRWLSLMEVNPAELALVEGKVREGDPDDFRLRILRKWSKELQLTDFVRSARKQFGANPRRLIRRGTRESALERRMQIMKKRLII